MDREEFIVLLIKKLICEYGTGTMVVKAESLNRYNEQTLIVEELDEIDGPYFVLSLMDAEMYAKLSNEKLRKLVIN